MSAIDQLVPSRRARTADTSPPTTAGTAYRGRATTDPADGVVGVVIRVLSDALRETCRYVAPAGPPQVGDECVVVFDERGEGWALFTNPMAETLKMGIASSFSLPYNTFTLATLDTVRYGDDTLHSTGGVPSRSMFAVGLPGVYRGVAYAEFAAGAGGNRWLSVMRATSLATERIAALAPSSLGGLLPTPVTVPFEAQLAEGEWLQFDVWQNQTSTGALDVTKLTFAIDRAG